MTHEHTTIDRIDDEHRANHHPDDSSTDSIATALEGRPLYDNPIRQRVDPYCQRCEQKNRKRRMAGLDEDAAGVEEGDRVLLYAVYCDDGIRRRHWKITKLQHARHPRLPWSDVVQRGVALVRATATIYRTPRELFVVDVEVTSRSRTDDGPAESLVDKRREKHIDDSDMHPDDMTVISPDPEDAPADWPDEDRQWLDDLISTHGPLSRPKGRIGGCDDSGTWDI